ncbi:MAG: AsmA-like C-terminal region-containing protein [Porticoccaceae bacterium]
MRTISLFNFANWARRLRLDFSDLFQKGMDYKNLHGGLIFNRGVMHFDPALVVEMSSGRMKMLGNANLITEQIDATLVTTLPVGTNLPWMAALVGGLPAAAGVYVTGKIFKKQVDQLSSIGYSIKGSWDDPSLQVNQIFSDSLRKAKGVDHGATLPENGQPDQKVDLQ